MNKTSLRLRQHTLRLRCNQLRESIKEDAQVLHHPLQLVDRVQRIVQISLKHPAYVAVALGALTLIKPHWAQRCMKVIWKGALILNHLR